MSVMLAFTTEQVSQLTGLSPYQLRYWADTDFYVPSYVAERGRPYGRVYSFRDLVALRTLAMLRREYQIPLQELRRVGAWLEDHYDAPWSSLRFYVAGRKVFFNDPDTGTVRSGQQPEQTVVPIEMAEIALSAEQDASRLNQRSDDDIGKVVRHRYTSHNAPTIAGTRIRTETISKFRKASYSDSQILREYPRLTRADIDAAVKFEDCAKRQATAYLLDQYWIDAS